MKINPNITLLNFDGEPFLDPEQKPLVFGTIAMAAVLANPKAVNAEQIVEEAEIAYDLHAAMKAAEDCDLTVKQLSAIRAGLPGLAEKGFSKICLMQAARLLDGKEQRTTLAAAAEAPKKAKKPNGAHTAASSL